MPRQMPEGEVVELSLSKTDFTYPSRSISKLFKSKPDDYEFKYDVTITWEGLSLLVANWKSSNKDRAAAGSVPTLSFQLGGTKGSSQIASLALNKEPTIQNGNPVLQLEVKN